MFGCAVTFTAAILELFSPLLWLTNLVISFCSHFHWKWKKIQK
jgi:hypothetical protein